MKKSKIFFKTIEILEGDKIRNDEATYKLCETRDIINESKDNNAVYRVRLLKKT